MSNIGYNILSARLSH